MISIRLKVAAIYSALSLVMSLIISAIFFRIWFPNQISEAVGSTSLYWLVVSISAVVGALLISVIWSSKKSRKELLIDSAIIVVIQVFALAYGIWTMYQVRPVYIIFETDRLRIVNAMEIDPVDLAMAPERWKNLPRLGLELASTRSPSNGDEMLRSIELSLAGKEPSLRPEMWEEYDLSKEKIRAASRSLSEFLVAYPEKQKEITSLAKKFDVPYTSIVWLPFTSARTMDWIALIDERNMEPFTFIPGDGFIPHR